MNNDGDCPTHGGDNAGAGSDDFILQIFRYLDDVMTDDEAARFLSSMEGDDSKQKLFVAACLQHRMFQSAAAPSQQANDDSRYGLDEDAAMSFQLLSELDDKQGEAAPVDVTELMHQRKIEARSKEKSRERSLQRHGGLTLRADKGSHTRHYVIPRPLFYGSIAAVIAVAAAILWPTVADHEQSDPNSAERPIIATLAATVDAVWANNRTFQANTPLRQGEYDLTQGLAKIVYGNGAEVILQGPVRFNLESNKRIRLHDGKVVGLCPTSSSKGFTVVTANANVKDVGTEFGVSVDSSGELIVQVYDGEVELTGTNDGDASSGHRLTKGMARRVDKSGMSITDIPMNEAAFVRETEYNANIQARNGSEYHQWLAQSFRLRRDPNALVYYAFDDEEESPNQLKNHAQSTIGRFDGNIFGATWAKGRLDGKRALHFSEEDTQFNGFGSYIEVKDSNEGPLEFGKTSFSIGIWFELSYLRFDDLFAPLITKGDDTWRLHIENKPRAIDWDINDLGKVSNRLVAQGEVPSRRWQFVMIVVEFDESSGHAEHRIYQDGIQTGRYTPTQSIHSNQASVLIGANAHVPGRRFIGAIDEVVIFDRALTSGEVEALHEMRFGVE